MSTSVQNVGMQRIPEKKVDRFSTFNVATGAIGGAALGAALSKPWLKNGHVSDKFISEISKEIYKNVPKKATTVSTIFDNWVSEAGGVDKLNKYFEPIFKDINKGSLKTSEELSGLFKGHEDLFKKALKTLKIKSVVKWATIGACLMAIPAALTKALLKKANVVEKNS